jgi:hypothetical protein
MIMFRRNRGDVSVVMLHTDQRHLKLHSQCGGISAGMEIRVQVVGDGMRFYTEPIK